LAKQFHYQICYPKKCVERVIDFYRNRGKYHEFVYQHKTSVAAGYMVMDILKLADPYFPIPTETPGVNLPISRAFNNKHAFEMLRDSIVDSIAFSTAPELKEARELAMRYKRRELYSKFQEKAA
jgi:HD superfamily phosphohydrolase